MFLHPGCCCRAVVDCPIQGKEAAKCLLMLCQGSWSVAEYAVAFRTLVAESGWNGKALQGFHNKLWDHIKDGLVAMDEPNFPG